jgi:NADH-quinone oxidoreductase subunit L
MLDLLWLIPTLPLAGFLAVLLTGRRIGNRTVALVAVGTVGASAVLAFAVAVCFIVLPPPGNAFRQTLWTWIPAAGFMPEVSLRLDALSLVMVTVITLVAFLILLYSSEFMAGDGGYSRFFAWMDLFVASMLVLVLADNFLVLYLGWEGVGLCSFLLIGFWYSEPDNARAARKAFIVTRVGDAALAVALFLIFTHLGTLHIQEAAAGAVRSWPVGSGIAVAAAALLLAGAVGKSAQLPLQVWLPDAMAGPTPVSALIHAATMVLMAGFCALAQWDIKRVLAYSTMSQIGYMFLALGVGAWSAAIFHFMVHAFFKSLLFLGAGAVIIALKREHNIFRMGGLRTLLPGTFWAFLIGAASLAALPLVTAGFYSKDLILLRAWSSPSGGPWLWAAGLAGALLTGAYAFRLVFTVFCGEPGMKPDRKPGFRMGAALAVLAFFSIVAGCIQVPATLANFSPLSKLLERTLPAAIGTPVSMKVQAVLECAAGVAALSGIFFAWFFFRRQRLVERIVTTGYGVSFHRLWLAGWNFDRAYDALFVRPYLWLAQVNRGDYVDFLNRVLVNGCDAAQYLLTATQNGRIRQYAAAITIGAIITVAIMVLL